jgi:exonuclease VII small subunit
VSLELLLDFSFKRTLPLLEQLNLPLDPPFQGALSQFEKALLLFKLLLEELQGRERHMELTLLNNCRFAIKSVKGRRASVKRQLPQAAPERLKNS